MAPLSSRRGLWPFLILVVLLAVLLTLELNRSAASSDAAWLFASVIRPTASATTGAATSTADWFRSPLATPTAASARPPAANNRTLNYRSHLPIIRTYPTPIVYNWKGLGNSGEVPDANISNGFWGVNPHWYYNWGNQGPWSAARSAQAQSAEMTAAQMAAAMAESVYYVPMIWCPDDVHDEISPATAAGIAHNYPGRVWLIFNEPDIMSDSDNCGTAIGTSYPVYFDGSHWSDLGKYLAQQYIRYYDTIVAADPTARLYSFGGLQPPGATGNNGAIARQIWNAFAGYLANPADEANKTPRPIHGIAMHAYPISASTNCSVADAACLQAALSLSHTFFQTHSMTAGKPIWITEIGNLQPGGSPPGSWQGRPTAQAYTANALTGPLLAWFTAHAVPGESVQYFNGLAWYSTHDCRYTKSGAIKDFTASDLLNIGPVNCPIPTAGWQTPAPADRLTVIGRAWATATCATCACPGPNCP